MNEHIKKILNQELIYYVHVALYIAITLFNIDTIFDSKVRDMEYPLSSAIAFTCLFAVMFIVETVSFYSRRPFLETVPAGLYYRIVRIPLVAIYYFMLPEQIGTGVCMVVLILFHIELLFYFQFDELPRRMFMYFLFGLPLEVITVFRMTHCGAVYRGIDMIVTANVILLAIVIISELVARTYNHFIQLLFEQNWTVDNLNEANERLKEQQEQIKKTNEMLGMQKIELQAANKKVNRSHDEMSVQNEIAGAITSSMEMNELLENVCRIVRVRLNMDVVCVVLEPDLSIKIPGRIKEERKLYFSTVFNAEYEEHIKDLILSGKVDDVLALSQTYVQNSEPELTKFFQVEKKYILESIVVVPLKKQNERIGNFIIGKRNINAFMDNKAFHENIAGQLSIGISNMRLYEKMKEMAIRDGLTQIYNRRHLTKLLNGYLAAALEKKTEVSLALFDIDKFKMVNDTYGHSCGDAVICHVAELLNQAAEENGGIAGRYGGEEFVIAFKGKSLNEVYKIVKEVHSRIKTESVCFENQELTVCASAGVASYPETCKNPSELLNRADWAMYHSKRNGRDRITIDSEDLETIM